MLGIIKSLKTRPIVKGEGIKPEDKLALEVTEWLANLTYSGLPIIWFHVTNESAGSNKVWNLLKKATGRIAGVSDYVILWQGGGLLLELKAGTKQSPAQKDFEEWCKWSGVRYSVCETLEQAKMEFQLSNPPTVCIPFPERA